MPSLARIKADEEARRIEANHQEGLKQAKKNKKIIREKGQALQDKYQGWAEKNKVQNAEAQIIIDGKREGEFTDVDKIGSEAKEDFRERGIPTGKGEVKLPPAVGNDPKEQKLSRAERKRQKKIRKHQAERAKLIDKHRKELKKKGISANVPGLEPDETPFITEEEKENLSEDEREILDQQTRENPTPDGPVELPEPVGSNTQSTEQTTEIGMKEDTASETEFTPDESPAEKKDAIQEAVDRREKERAEREANEKLRTHLRRRLVKIRPLARELKDNIKEGLTPEEKDDPDDKDLVIVEMSKHLPEFERLLKEFDVNLQRSINSPSANRSVKTTADKLQISITAFAPSPEVRTEWISILDRIRGEL